MTKQLRRRLDQLKAIQANRDDFFRADASDGARLIDQGAPLEERRAILTRYGIDPEAVEMERIAWPIFRLCYAPRKRDTPGQVIEFGSFSIEF
jgi:hypothetical protein